MKYTLGTAVEYELQIRKGNNIVDRWKICHAIKSHRRKMFHLSGDHTAWRWKNASIFSMFHTNITLISRLEGS